LFACAVYSFDFYFFYQFVILLLIAANATLPMANKINKQLGKSECFL